MGGVSAKQRALEVMEKLPDGATLEDAIDRLILLAKIERGLAELAAERRSVVRSGRVVPEVDDETLQEVTRGHYRVVYRQTGGAVEIVTVVPSGHQFRLDWS